MASLRRILAVCCIQMGVATSSTLCAHRHSTIELLIYFMYRGKYDDDDDDYSAIDLMTLNNFFLLSASVHCVHEKSNPMHTLS